MILPFEEGLTFDDVLIIPELSDVSPGDADVSSVLVPSIKLNSPILSAGMDTVTEAPMAIAMARQGGMGVIHRNMPVLDQAGETDRVKRSEHSIINEPFTMSPNQYIHEAADLMERYHISGVPVTEHGNLLGIITKRDLRFESDYSKKVYEVMTSENLITAPVGTTLDEARSILISHKIEKLPIVDEMGKLKGLITVKDMNKNILYPNSSKDASGRLVVGASAGIADDLAERVDALSKIPADVIFLDVLEPNAKAALKHIRTIKDAHPNLPLVAGNVATAESARMLFDAGADAVKVGVGPSSVSTTRVVTGVGVPQLTAIINCAKAAREYGKTVIADGGIRYSGDIIKALAAGASACMLGNLLAGCEESPGAAQMYRGRKYKEYRGLKAANADVPEGVEGRISYKGSAAEVITKLLGGLRAGMAYCGCGSIEELHEKARFIKVTGQGLRESHPHDIQITRESTNYSAE
ncbi:MAG: IMP dehydrogenase [Defluviitaleaceae bacterium]|nr:IMP dehydrogenase [Defluviitaleaceae bacterium]